MTDKEIFEIISGIESAIDSELSKVIVGQKEVIEKILIALLSGGHVLIIGVPGLAKTLLVKTLAEILDLKFSRIQFTPDLMPSDIIGTDIIEEDPATGKRHFKFVKGPVFANMILADEINRTPPKTQSALLEAMQELRVTAGGNTYELEKPFFDFFIVKGIVISCLDRHFIISWLIIVGQYRCDNRQAPQGGNGKYCKFFLHVSSFSLVGISDRSLPVGLMEQRTHIH